MFETFYWTQTDFRSMECAIVAIQNDEGIDKLKKKSDLNCFNIRVGTDVFDDQNIQDHSSYSMSYFR